MTSEIALMNRRAVALAADSATTIQFWENGEKKLRYSKGANKIFNLSSVHPVAVMTYDSGNLHGIPWEILVKAYREHLASASRDFLPGYSADFLEYIQKNRDLYVDETQIKQLIKATTEQAAALIQRMDPDRAGAAERDLRKKTKLMEDGFQVVQAEVNGGAFIGGWSDRDVAEILQRSRRDIVDALEKDRFIVNRAHVLDLSRLADLAVRALFSPEYSTMEKAGLVICGFGQKDYFPVVEQYVFWGIVMGRLLYERADFRQISQENITEILPFAQSEMCKAFMYGAQPQLMASIESSVSKSFDNFETSLHGGDHLGTIDLTEMKAAAQKELFSELAVDLNETHTVPMKRVVGLLGIAELAELAEMLVRLESLKERFTRDSDSVGGPIDVAVISKGDGFIWIKRKQYFDPDLNPRYQERRPATSYGA